MSHSDGPSSNPLTELLRRLRLPWRKVQPARPTGDRLIREKFRAQLAVVHKAFDGEVAVASSRGPHRAKDHTDAAYLFRPAHTLVHGERMGEVMDFFERRSGEFRGSPEQIGEPTPGLALLRLPARTDDGDDVLVTLEELERELGPTEQDGRRVPVATPDHIVYVTPIKAGMCPATEPETTRSRRPWPPQDCYDRKIPDDQKVRVTVVDSGLWEPAVGSAESPWLEKDDIFAGNEDLEQVIPAAIHEYAGHGTFVAGVISCLAPETRIDVEGALTRGGAVYESDLTEQLEDALAENRPQVISISAGTHTRNDDEMLSFVLLAQNNRFDERDDVLIVAAAGNDSSNDPFWPAAFSRVFPWVVSVGSVDPDQKVSDFSNYGKDWVSVYARGRDLVNAYPKGTYKCYEPPNVGQLRKFDGLAQWSGTSFSTPIVTGLIAAEMRDNGLSARAAWDVVRKTAIDFHDTRIGEDIKIVGPLS